MKILSLHCDYIKFKPVKPALKGATLEKAEEKQIEVSEPLVLFTAIEKQDEANKNILEEYLKNILDLKDKVKAEQVVLYPYAHLSSSLSSPDFAKKLMIDAEASLKKQKIKVARAPFGYYKEFELKCKGHPLAELARTIGTEQAQGKVEVTKKMKNEYHEPDLTPAQRENLWKMMSKVHMTASPGEKGLKSNVELGRDLDLYLVSEIVGKGLPLFTPRGSIIRRELERFNVDEELKRGYVHTSTPIMAKADLYRVSGHWQHYKDSMFVLNVGDEEFALRPMTCPFQFVIYKSKPRSHKELPIRYAEMANLFRNEQTGELRGLTRVRQFSLSDAHIICKPEQLEEEFGKVVDFIKYIMKTLGIEVWYRFSKWDSKDKGNKYIDNPAAWEASQKSMKKILDNLKIKYVEAEGEAAFYGPKLDLQYKDVYGKEDTLITVQIDFALPERYDLTYLDENNKLQRPMVIHRSSVGCIERTLSYLLEKTQGNLPTWLSPVQVRVISFTDRNIKACEKLVEELRAEGIRVDADLDSNTVNDKVRKAAEMKIPYLITIGDKEEEKKTLAIKKRGETKPKFGVKKTDFIKEILSEINERK
ncbi:threonine--tRNA ligase [Candidatus Pacearchaeota archaeon]|nr:threonine--tRNA ligase [Candidatus Pacearchaeota archaeon]